jgi:NADH-quinone oxidoreductase subunit M
MPDRSKSVFIWTLLIAVVQLLIYSVFICGNVDDGWASITKPSALTEYIKWIELTWSKSDRLVFAYHLRIDGLSHAMVLLTVILQPIIVLASLPILKNRRAYFSLLLLLNASILGCFLAFDLFLFYIFFEFMLLPLYFLIAYWGGEERESAALNFFLYTLIGSLVLLIVLFALLFSYPTIGESSELIYNLDLTNLINLKGLLAGSLLDNLQFRWLAFGAILLAFSIKIPVVPVHTWLPQAHVQAPTAISIVLAALLLKVGGYGLIRLGAGIFPDQVQAWAPVMGWLAIISILYGGFAALAEQHFKRLIAFSSISHMGFVLLGIAAATPEALSGAQLQMFNHGILSSALFLTAGFLYVRFHDYRIPLFSGLLKPMPAYGFLTAWVFFAALGLPGLNAFVSEFLVLIGAFRSLQLSAFIPQSGILLAASGIFLSASYLLYAYRRMFLGPLFLNGGDAWLAQAKDIRTREYLAIVPLCLLMLVLGLFPNLILSLSEQSFADLTEWIFKRNP